MRGAVPGPKANPRMPGRSLDAQIANAATRTSARPPQNPLGPRMTLRVAGAEAPPWPSDISPLRLAGARSAATRSSRVLPQASTAAPPGRTKAAKAHTVNEEILRWGLKWFGECTLTRPHFVRPPSPASLLKGRVEHGARSVRILSAC